MFTKAILGLFFLTSLHLYAEENNKLIPDFHDGTISFYLDNDLFFGSDRDYTNGARLAWISGERKNLNDISPIQRGLEALSGNDGKSNIFSAIWGFEPHEELSYQYGAALSQLIYTPTDTSATPPKNERPYAAWAGLGFSLHVSNEKAINSIELNLGLVGPDALGEQFQDTVHNIIGSELFNGWHNQIPNELTFNIHFNQKRRYTIIDEIFGTPFSLNSFSEIGSSFGNFRVDASIGWQYQLGYNVPVNFSDPRLSPTANAVSWSTSGSRPNFSAYLLGGVKGSIVLQDITIDGPVFSSFDSGASSRLFQAEFFYGLGVRYKDYELSYIKTSRTKEYDRQSDSQDFGSLAIRISY